MARYWVYINDEVAGPFALEQLVRQRGFSRQTLICIDDSTGKPTHWISPAEIPELAHIFKAVDEHMTAPPPAAPRKVPLKLPMRAPKPYQPAVTLKAPTRDFSTAWVWSLLVGLLLAGGAFKGFHYIHRDDQAHEQETAKSLVENARLPASSLFSTLRQYLQEKELTPRWEFQKVQEGLYQVTLSWYPPPGQAGTPGLRVYAFETNAQAQTVRGINSAATKLLSEGFPPPPSAQPKIAPAPKKSPSELFNAVVAHRSESMESGDFQGVWGSFSQRKRAEMTQAGMSHDGYVRLQNLTRRVDSPVKQSVLKTKQESETEMLALIKQSQPNHPDMFIKQRWVFEKESWKLDDEQKKSGEAVPSPTPDVERRTLNPVALPGMSK